MNLIRLYLAALLVSLPLAASPMPANPALAEQAQAQYLRRDYAQAFDNFSTLAAAGDPQAQTILALMYRFGEGVAQDSSQAFYWYREAAMAGYGPAQFQLGDLYARGEGTQADPALAIEWLRKAEAADFSRATARLAELGSEPPTTPDTAPYTGPPVAWNLRLPNSARQPPVALPAQTANTTGTMGVYHVQLGAMTTRAAAERLWQILQDNHSELFKGRQHTILTTASNREGALVSRLQAGPFASLADAQGLCRQLQAKNGRNGCLPLLSRDTDALSHGVSDP
jgi:cell division septation protein DedD